MKTKATVIATDGEYATVETERTSACEGCHKSDDGKGCSVCSLMGSQRKISTRAINRIGAQVGDTVSIEARTDRVMGYAALVFLLPLVLALVGYGIASLFTASTVWRAVGAGAGLAITFMGLFFYSRALQTKKCEIEITEILQKEGIRE